MEERTECWAKIQSPKGVAEKSSDQLVGVGETSGKSEWQLASDNLQNGAGFSVKSERIGHPEKKSAASGAPSEQ